MHSRIKIDLQFFSHELEETHAMTENSRATYARIYLDMLNQQRCMLDDMNKHAEFDEELIRKYLSIIDVEEFRARGEKEI
jgi:CPA1 family monovalent cation:H+ antiporter